MAWGYPFPAADCGCCEPITAPVPYHIRKYTNSSAMTLLASQSDNRLCRGVRWDGTALLAIYGLTEPGLGTASGSDHFLRAINYDVSLATVRQVLHEYNSSSVVNIPGVMRSVFLCGDGTYCMTASRSTGTARQAAASRNADDTKDWETSMDPGPGGSPPVPSAQCVVGDSSGNVYLYGNDSGGQGILYKFDNAGVKQWSLTGAGVLNSTPRLITIASDGFIWTSGNGSFSRVTTAGALSFTSTTSIDYQGNLESDGGGGVWIGGTTNGIYRYNSSGVLIAEVVDPLLVAVGGTVSKPNFAVDSSNNVYGIILDSGVYKVRKWAATGSGTGSALEVPEWTSGDIGFSVGAPPRGISVDGSFIFVGGEYNIP